MINLLKTFLRKQNFLIKHLVLIFHRQFLIV
nr:MAG TPA: hypothetical protein [Caudoviricetes sp.]